MNSGSAILDQLRAALTPHGVFVRGVARFADGDGPVVEEGRTARSVVLLGNVGGSIWTPFSLWRDRPENRACRDPLDNWSKAIIRPLAELLGATAFFPSDPPWQPFQQWAMRAEGLKASPLGILIHPVFGLWHGYRGALGFVDSIDIAEKPIDRHPCDSCQDKPCLATCPVGAVTLTGFDVAGCRAHLRGDQGQAGCMAGGCLARNACPVGAEYRYSPAQRAFHMAALSP